MTFRLTPGIKSRLERIAASATQHLGFRVSISDVLNGALSDRVLRNLEVKYGVARRASSEQPIEKEV